MYMEPDLRKIASERVRKKKEFYTHLAVFLAVGLFFLLFNLLTYNRSGHLWFYFPLLPWSVGLIIHYLSVFGFPGSGILTPEWEREEVEREVARLSGREAEAGDNSPTSLEKETLDLPPLEAKKEARWEEDDIV